MAEKQKPAPDKFGWKPGDVEWSRGGKPLPNVSQQTLKDKLREAKLRRKRPKP